MKGKSFFWGTMSFVAIAYVLYFSTIGLAATTNTITFRNGVNGYTKTQDVALSTLYAREPWNGGHGTTFRTDPRMGCYVITTEGNKNYEVEDLIRFGGISIPPGAHITSASLALTFYNWNTGISIRGFYVKNSWDQTSPQLTWLNRNRTLTWSSPGARGIGTDLISGKNFTLNPAHNGGPGGEIQVLTVPLDLDIVSGWLTTPNSNQGVLLINETSDKSLFIYTSENSNVNYRPLLSITYELDSIQPPVAPTNLSGNATSPSKVALSWNDNSNNETGFKVERKTGVSGNYEQIAVTAANAIGFTDMNLTPDTQYFYRVQAMNLAGSSVYSNEISVTTPSVPVVSISISPVNITLNTGATQQFTATVTGSANTSVTWTATGGTINTSGLYTASSSAGDFMVTATSVADPTKDALAVVHVVVPIPPTNTVTFRNGVNGYTGSQDVALSTLYAQEPWNGGHGTTFVTDPQMGCYTITTQGSGNYEVEDLIRFGGISIPPGTHVTAARLTLTFYNWNDTVPLRGFYLKNSWDQNSPKLTWLNRNETLTWGSPGARGIGTDLFAGKNFAMNPANNGGIGSEIQVLTVPLDLEVVNGWVTNPNSNQGVLIISEASDKVCSIYASEESIISYHPLLSITYESNSSSIPLAPSNLQGTATSSFQSTLSWNDNSDNETGFKIERKIGISGNYAQISVTAENAVGFTDMNLTPDTQYFYRIQAVNAVGVSAYSNELSITTSALPVVSIAVSPTTASLNTGATQQFTATVTGSANTSVTWTTTGGTVSSSGLYTAPSSAGSSTVTATSVADPTKSASASITVVAPPPVISVTISPTTASLNTGATQQFTATVTGSANTSVTWTTTGGTVSSSGLYTAPSSAGSSTVTATSVADPTKSASASVTVIAPPVISVTVSPTTASLNTGATQQFTATVTGSANTSVTWTTTGGTVSSSGLYTAPSSAGSFTVTATSVADPTKSASASITVVAPPVISVTVSPTTASLNTGATQQFTATVTGSANTSVTWTTTGGTVSSSGLYTAPSSAGSFTVTATSVADPTKSASALVTVQQQSGNVDPFFAPPQSSGQMTVKLYPTEVVTPGSSKLVTFGVPFTRGSLTETDLAKVHIFQGSNEIPIYTGMLTPWRHINNPSIDGTSVRIARIQLHYTFSVASPNFESITLTWGGSPRSSQFNVSTLENPRTAWHLVTSGSFISTDNVFEPDVYAALPKEIMVQGLLNPMRMTPLDPIVGEQRLDPATALARTWTGFQKFDHAQNNFFFTIVNQDDPRVTPANQNPYKTDSEPWLYDRSAAMFTLYFRSGFINPLREGVRNAQFYNDRIWPAGTSPAYMPGLFKLKVPTNPGYADGNFSMYSYNECLAYNYWLTGDDTVLPQIRLAVQAHNANTEPTRWSPTLAGWTERHTAFHLLANIIAYEVFGEASYKSAVQTQTGDFIWHQNGAGGQIPASRIDGGLYHYGRQHGDGPEDMLCASSWMTALTSDAMVRAYAFTESTDIANFVRRLGTFERAACKTDGNHDYDTGALLYPDYMMVLDGTTGERDGTEVEHAPEVTTVLAWSNYFANLLAQPNPLFKTTAMNLYQTYSAGVNHWTRPGGPAAGLAGYRVAPPRKYGWQYRASGSLPWLLK